MVAKYAVKRAALKAIIADKNASDEDRWDAQMKLQSLPEMRAPFASSVVVVRPVGLMGFTESSASDETSLREAAMRGDVPGLVKASW